MAIAGRVDGDPEAAVLGERAELAAEREPGGRTVPAGEPEQRAILACDPDAAVGLQHVGGLAAGGHGHRDRGPPRIDPRGGRVQRIEYP